MIIKEFKLIEDKPWVTLTAYMSDLSKEIPYNEQRKAMLIIPGGGYEFVSDREGEPIAYEFLANGYNCFVLRYSVKENCYFPTPLIEASLAMKFIKDHSDEFHIRKDDVSVIGFSAGGHMAALLGTMWHTDYVYSNIDMEYGYNKPKAMILAYPVILGCGETHKGTINTILKDKVNDPECQKLVSLDEQVSEKTVPAYIWHTFTDTTVPVVNSIKLSESLAKYKIPFELHIFPNGGHGMSSCKEQVRTEHEYNKRWVSEAIHFLNKLD